jgi:hypothetical protein
MKLKPRKGSWILAVLFAVAICFPATTKASVEPGLDVTVYDNFGYNASPPLPDVSGRPVAGTMTASHIDQDFDSFPPFGLYEDFIVKYEGHITSPITGAITFMPTADDGTKLFLDGILVDNNWRDKGGGGNPTAPQQFTAGESREITFWFYENGGSAWTTLYWNLGNGWEIVPASAFTKNAVTTTTTTLAPYLNNPRNLVVSSTNESKVYLSWEAPEASNVQVERYAIFFSKDNFASGWAISSTQTFAVVENLDPSTDYQFKVRADNDSLGVYSGWSNQVVGRTDDLPVFYSLTNAVWDTANEGSNLTLSAPNGNVFTEVLFASYGTPTGSNGLYRTSQCHSVSSVQEVNNIFIGQSSGTISADNGVFGDPCGGTYKYLTVALKYSPAPTTTTVAPVVTWPSFTTTTTVEPTTTTTTTTTSSSTTTTSSTTSTSTSTTTLPPVESTTTTTTSTTTTTTTLPPIEEKIPVPAVEDIEKIETKEELQKLVETVDLKNIEPDQAVALVSNKAFMDLPTEQLTKVFDSIPVDELTEEQESQLVETLTSAPDEVKDTFEASVDVYASGLDDYVAVGSSIDVGTRRSLIAATTVLSTVAVAPASSGGSGGGGGSTPKTGGSGGGSSGNGGSGSGDSSNPGRKEDEPEEDEEEESAEIEGPEGDEEEGNFTKNSIFKYEEGTMKKRFSPWGFIKKFSKETAAMAFTISGSVVVFATLSGETRKITLIATSVAFVVHYINAMLQNDEE